MSESLRPRKRHEMKIWPEFYEPTLRGTMRFTLRRDDREDGFRMGDELLLREWNPDVYQLNLPMGHRTEEDIQAAIEAAYTGREVLVRVDYVMPVETVDRLMDLEIPYPAEHVIMSISRVH